MLSSGEWTMFTHENPMALKDVEPLVGPNSIDVTLDAGILVPQCPAGVIDPYDPQSLQWTPYTLSEGKPFLLEPGMLALGSVMQRLDCTAPVLREQDSEPLFFAQMYEGRSTCGRMGLASHVTAGFGDYGFKGAFTLELFSVSPYPIKLYKGMRIGQIYLDQILGPEHYAGAYSQENHYQGAQPPVLGKHRFMLG